MLGRYLDALSDEQRDRVIKAKDFLSSDTSYVEDCVGCLVGVAEMNLDVNADRPIHFQMTSGDYDAPGYRFPRLCARFGKDRIVRLCKQRAAKGNAPTVTEIRTEVVAGRQRTAFMYGSTLLGR